MPFLFSSARLSLARASGRRECRKLQIEPGEILFPGLNSSLKVKQDGAAMSAESRRIARFAQVRFGCLNQNFDLFASRHKFVSHAIAPPAWPLARRPVAPMGR
jgi:hypothetical protein